jgi:hypothetical protein
VALANSDDEVDADGRRVGVRYPARDDPMLDPRRVELGHQPVDHHREPSVARGDMARLEDTFDQRRLGIDAWVSAHPGGPSFPQGRKRVKATAATPELARPARPKAVLVVALRRCL